MSDADDGFLARWSRRKAELRDGRVPPQAAPAPAPAVAPVEVAAQRPPPAPADEAAPAPPPPTLDEAQALTPASDFTRFVARDVDPSVKNAALKKLFADPQFNVMDGLDTYIDDYGRPDPLPEGMLRRMAQSAALGLFRDEPAPAETGAPAHAAPKEPADEDADLRLQPHHAAGREPAPAPEPGAGEDPARQS